jgi:hypothetical protein
VQILLISLAPVLMLASLWCLWRAVRLLIGWRPATASVVNSDYGEGQQQEDFWVRNSLMTTRGFSWRDGEDGRLIEDRIFFDDAAGMRHRVTVKRRVRRGWRPWSVYTIWYDPAAPGERVTAFGPGHWLLLALVWGACLAMLFVTGTQLAGAKG